MDIVLRPIGVIRSPFLTVAETPIQPTRSDAVGRVELLPRYEAGLDDIEGFSHVILISHLHLSSGFELRVKPFLEKRLRGLFATRHPRRPNPIGLSVVRLLRREGAVLTVHGIDVVDGTPLLDIKPHVPALEGDEELRLGWIEELLPRADRRSR